MKTVLIVLAVVLTIPLLTAATLYLRGGKVVIVRNAGAAGFETSAMIKVDGFDERTPTEVLDAGKTTWFMFYPKLKGPLQLRCVDSGGLSLIQLGPLAPTRLLYADVTLNGCRNLVKRSGFDF
jgi:hypothetical protein